VSAQTPPTSRRSAFRTMFAALGAATAGLFGGRAAHAAPRSGATLTIPEEDQAPAGQPQRPRLFSSARVHGGLVFIAGKGYHQEGDITVHTRAVLDDLQKELEKAGSSMEKVLKVNVYLHDLGDYDKMNEVFRGRFGDNPPVRTTIAAYGGIPGNSLVEIDCIAAL
jgi:2-iminobutanoate/2-iminopropanoate deaminase